MSRYLKGAAQRPDTRERVAAALADLRYRPNHTARRLADGRSRRIAAVTHDLIEVGPSRTLHSAGLAIRDAGYTFDTVSLGGLDDAAVAAVLAAIGRDIDGVLAFSGSPAVLSALADGDIPVPVHVDTGGHTDADNLASQRQLVDHLTGLGHRRIACLSGPTRAPAGAARAEAAVAALREAGLEPAWVGEGAWSSEAGYKAADGIIAAGDVTAVMAGNDQIALGIVAALDDRGIDVPGDVSVVGFDDIPESAYFRPPLTTIRQDFELLGRYAADGILALVEPQVQRAQLPPITTDLVVRRSTAPAR